MKRVKKISMLFVICSAFLIGCDDNITQNSGADRVTGLARAIGDEITITYEINKNWGNGFLCYVTIENNGDTTIDGWTLEWEFTGNQQVKNFWGATVTQTGQAVSAVNVDYTAMIQPGGQQSFGFVADYTGSNAEPTGFVFNGKIIGTDQPPVVSITSPAHDITRLVGSDVMITAEASDSNGTVTAVEFYAGTELLGTDSTAPYEYTLVNPEVGTYTITAKAIDNDAFSTISQAVIITIRDNPPLGERYYPLGTNIEEMKSLNSAMPVSEVKRIIYKEIDEHWDLVKEELDQAEKLKVYALFLGLATRESTLNAGVETAYESGFGVNPAHAYGPFQTAVTAFAGANPEFSPEDDVPEMYQYLFTEENFYDPLVSNHMGIRKVIHFIRQAESYGCVGLEIVRNAIKGFNTGWANPIDDDGYYASYTDEIAALARWYYQRDHYYDDVFTWTGSQDVDRVDPWGWW